MRPLCERELSDICGAGFLNFYVEHRDTVTETHALRPDDILSHDVAVIDIDTRVDVHAQIDSLKLCYYRDGLLDIDWDINIEKLEVGEDDKPLSLNGLKIEVAFDDINSTDRKLYFVKIGTPDLTGQFDVSRLGGGFNKVSFDGTVDLLGETLPLIFNSRRELLGNLLNRLVFDHTDFFLAIANRFEDSGNNKNDEAFCPRTTDAIPGYGAWLHFIEAKGKLL
jgi:hypothetical protein